MSEHRKTRDSRERSPRNSGDRYRDRSSAVCYRDDGIQLDRSCRSGRSRSRENSRRARSRSRDERSHRRNRGDSRDGSGCDGRRSLSAGDDKSRPPNDSSWEAELARGSEAASAAAERTRRRRSGWDMMAPDPSAAPPPQTPQQQTRALSSSSGPVSTDDLFLANYGLPVVAINVKENCVARIVGRGGETIKHVEQATGAVVKLDKSSRSTGISVCRIYGAQEAAQRAADMIRLKIASVAPVAQEDLPIGFFTEEFKVEQRLIGLILGRGGEGLKKIQDDSGASVCFHKDEESLDAKGRPKGDSFHIVGRRENIEKAKAILYSRLQQQYVCTYGREDEDYTVEDNVIKPGDIVRELNVQQAYVGRIIGKGRGAIRPILDETGCRVQLDQSTKDKGYSVIRVIGSPEQVEQGYDLVFKAVDRAQKGASDTAGDWSCPGCGDVQFARNRTCRKCGTEQPHDIAVLNAQRDKIADDEIRVEQKFVGFIIGPGGQTLKQIKEQSGARVFVDQETKDKGYSIVRIGQPGSPQNNLAHEMIQKKLDECKKLPSNRPPIHDQSSPMILNPVITTRSSALEITDQPQQSQQDWTSQQGWQHQPNGSTSWDQNWATSAQQTSSPPIQQQWSPPPPPPPPPPAPLHQDQLSQMHQSLAGPGQQNTSALGQQPAQHTWSDCAQQEDPPFRVRLPNPTEEPPFRVQLPNSTALRRTGCGVVVGKVPIMRSTLLMGATGFTFE